MNWKAEFVLTHHEYASFFIEMHGTYSECVLVAQMLAEKLGVQFTGLLEELK